MRERDRERRWRTSERKKERETEERKTEQCSSWGQDPGPRGTVFFDPIPPVALKHLSWQVHKSQACVCVCLCVCLYEIGRAHV